MPEYLGEIPYDQLVAELKRRRLTDMSDSDLEAELSTRYEEKWQSVKNTDPTEHKVDVDALLDDRVPTSKPQKIKVGGQEHTVVFRAMGGKQAQVAETFAEGYITKLNEEAGLPYEHINSMVAQERIADEKLTRIIFSVCLKPGGGPPAPAFDDLDHFRKKVEDREREAIMRAYERWYNRERIPNMDSITEEEFQFMVDEIKKNGQDPLFWTSVDWITLASFALTSAYKLRGNSLTDKSGDTSSS